MAGEQQQNVKPEDARAFLGNIVSDPETLKTWDDAKVLAFHGNATKFVDGAVQAAVKKASESAPPFSEKWREAIAGDNADAMKTLTRFKDPSAMFQSYEAMRQKFDSGSLKVVTPFPEKGTDAEKAAWRKEQGIPDSPDKYELKFDNGLVIGEGDKPIVDAYLKHAHSRNFTPAQVKENIGWFLSDFKTMVEQDRAEGMAKLKQGTEDKLREAWKGDYRMMRTAVDNLVAGHFGGTDSDLGKLVLASVDTNPEFAQSLAKLALELNPAAPLMPPVDGAAAQLVNIETKIKEIEALMRTNRPEYNRREAEYRQLLEARDKIKGRSQQAA